MYSRETWTMAAKMLCLTLAAAVAGGLLCGIGAVLLCAGLGLALTGIAVGGALARLREVAQLSDYLAAVYAGGQTADIRDQRPGELSRLKDDLYKVTTILRQQAAQLEQDKRFLSDTLGNIAHQLKTPLCAILLQTELWESGTGSMRDECASQIQQQALRMQWLVQQLLRLSRLDAGVVEFVRQTQSARQLIERAAEGVEPLFRRRQVQLEIRCGDEETCSCDGEWTAQALLNLLQNAAEHTPAGGMVRVVFAASPLDVSFVVEDEGGGIPENELPHLFERFWRGKHARPGSAGIGLSLAKAIAQGQGGSLIAENIPGGARLTLRLFHCPV